MNDNIFRDVIRSLRGKRTKGTPIAKTWLPTPIVPYWQTWRPPKDPTRTRYPWDDDRTKWERFKDRVSGFFYVIFSIFFGQ